MKVNDRVLRMIGLARRAGKVQAGAFLAEKSVHRGDACLVIIAADAAQNAKKRMKDACAYYGVEYIEYADKEALAACIGKENIATVCINDESLAKGIKDKYRESFSDGKQ